MKCPSCSQPWPPQAGKHDAVFCVCGSSYFVAEDDHVHEPTLVRIRNRYGAASAGKPHSHGPKR